MRRRERLLACLLATLAGCPAAPGPGSPASPAAPASATPAPTQPASRPAGPDTRAALSDEARAVLEQPDELEVLALVCEREAAPGEPTFHRYPVAKRLSVPPAERVALVDALYAAIEGAHGAARCFEPHHGITARRGDAQVDLVICFRCSNFEAFGAGVPASPNQMLLHTIGVQPLQPALARLLGEAPAAGRFMPPRQPAPPAPPR